MSEKITLSGVPETMLQTVYARAKETKTRGAITDNKAVEIIDRLDYDFSMADSLEDRPFPPLTRKMQEHCFFEFGSTEDHFKYRDAVRKAYPDGHFPVFEEHDHMQYQIRDPQGFAAMLEHIIEQNELPPLPFLRK